MQKSAEKYQKRSFAFEWEIDEEIGGGYAESGKFWEIRRKDQKGLQETEDLHKTDNQQDDPDMFIRVEFRGTQGNRRRSLERKTNSVEQQNLRKPKRYHRRYFETKRKYRKQLREWNREDDRWSAQRTSWN